ncbi:hypothetical protein F4801DRAFT_592701 [Xylaria longipes]|nr:hypothetical protein F4801DRAFT_592701 [Xylaria longipes]
MATYQQLKHDPRSQVLFNNRIATMEGLQIGLAYIPTIAPRAPIAIPSQLQRPRLHNFYNKNQLQSLTLNINLSNQTREDLIRCRGSIPNRRPSRFGHEYQIDLDNLESAIIRFIQSCHHNPSTKLVLIGFGMPAEWTYLLKTFPRVIPYFTSWIDLRDIAKDIAITGDALGQCIPRRITLLQIFGYHWRNIIGSNRHGSGDNAGDDAISTLAMADAFFYPENQEKLRVCQKCEQIACKSHVYNEDNITFGATIRSQKGLLPNTINSSMKLARYFFDFMPISIALKSTEVAIITFDSESHLNRFIQTNHQRSLPTSGTLLVKRQLREIKKAERLKSEFEGFGKKFS